MGCFCCISEDARIGRVLSRFNGTLPSQAEPGCVAKVVGRVACAGQALISPISGRPCVYYDVTVEELRERRDSDGRVHRHWVRICYEEQSCDFQLTDDTGGAVYVIARPGMVKSYGVEDCADGSRAGFFGLGEREASPGLVALLERHGRSASGWFGFAKNLRAREAVFDIGEPVAALGVVTDAGNQLQLNPLQQSALSESWMDSQGWEDHDKRSWAALTGQYQAVLLSDSPQLVGGLIARGVAAGGVYAPPAMQAAQQQQQAQQQPLMQPPQQQQQPAMAVAVARPVQKQVITLQVPPNCMPGQQIQFALPDGRQAQAQVPQGAAPGSTFQVQV